MSTPVPQDVEMMWRAVNQAFMNQINVILNYIGNFEPNTLALLSDAEYKQRRSAVAVCARVFMNANYRKNRIEWSKSECDHFHGLCFHKVKDGTYTDEKTGEEKQKWRDVCHDLPEAAIWTDMKSRCVRLETINEGVIDMSKAALALFRRLGIAEAFEAYEETVADLLGVDKRGVTKAQTAIKGMDAKKSFKEKLAEKMDRSKKDGVLSKEVPLAE